MKRFAKAFFKKSENQLLPVNIPVIELTRRMLVCGALSAKGILLLALYYIKLIVVMPVAFLQYLFYSRRINKTVITKQPVFIIGHYRSGTTYLHKLLASDNRFAYLSNYDMICPNSSLLFGKWLQNLLQYFINSFQLKTSFFNNKIALLEEPAEEERFLINQGSAYTDYWRFVFPLCWNKLLSCSQLSKNPNYYQRWKKAYISLLKLITFKNKGRQLILKSPPNTGRIKYLLEIFPDAKFIYIYRNPYHIFYSMCNLWNKAIRKFCLQKISDEQIEAIVFNEYIHLVDQYEKDKILIPAGNLTEVQYEELEAYPVNVLRSIYKELNIQNFETVLNKLMHQLQKESRYRKFEYAYREETCKKIEKRWGKYIYQWKQKLSAVTVKDYV
jgi:hypothetical protein